MSENDVDVSGGNWLLGLVSTAIGLWSGLHWDQTFETAHALGEALPHGLVEFIAWAIVLYGTVVWVSLFVVALFLLGFVVWTLISLFA